MPLKRPRKSQSVVPYAKLNMAQGRMYVAGENGTDREVQFLNKHLVIDTERGQRGWLLLDIGDRDWQGFPPGDGEPEQPSPKHKLGFWVLVYAPTLFNSKEAHEMCNSSVGYWDFIGELYDQCEPHFGQGRVPVVKITEAKLIPLGKGNSCKLRFEIVKWIPRPPAIIEALAKVKAAAAKSGATADDDFNEDNSENSDDFENEDVETKAAPKDEPKAKAGKKSAKPKAEKPAKAETASDVLLDDEIPF